MAFAAALCAAACTAPVRNDSSTAAQTTENADRYPEDPPNVWDLYIDFLPFRNLTRDGRPFVVRAPLFTSWLAGHADPAGRPILDPAITNHQVRLEPQASVTVTPRVAPPGSPGGYHTTNENGAYVYVPPPAPPATTMQVMKVTHVQNERGEAVENGTVVTVFWSGPIASTWGWIEDAAGRIVGTITNDEITLNQPPPIDTTPHSFTCTAPGGTQPLVVSRLSATIGSIAANRQNKDDVTNPFYTQDLGDDGAYDLGVNASLVAGRAGDVTVTEWRPAGDGDLTFVIRSTTTYHCTPSDTTNR
jgi:hypothetical protein